MLRILKLLNTSALICWEKTHIFGVLLAKLQHQNGTNVQLDSQWFVLNVLSGGRGRSCVQGNGGNVCTENTNNSSLSAEPCRGQACPLRYAAATTSVFLQDSLWYSAPDLCLLLVSSRWRAEPWSPCSASCGGGSQTRRVRCIKGPDSRWREVGSQHCLVTGRRPSIVRVCNQQPCGRWTTTQWGPVSPSAAMMLFLIVPRLFLSAHVQPFLPLFLIWVRFYPPVSRSVCGSQFGHSVPTRLLPRRQRHQSPWQDVRQGPEVSPVNGVLFQLQHNQTKTINSYDQCSIIGCLYF